MCAQPFMLISGAADHLSLGARALRWREALVAGMAPPVVLESTHERALAFVSLQALAKPARSTP